MDPRYPFELMVPSSLTTAVCSTLDRSHNDEPTGKTWDSTRLRNGTRGGGASSEILSSSKIVGTTEATLFFATSMYVSSLSIVMKFRFRRLATAAVVPVPQNGSKIVSPGLLVEAMM